MFKKIWDCLVSLFSTTKEDSTEKVEQEKTMPAMGILVLTQIPKLKDRGEEVRKFQLRLNGFGYGLTADGIFGALTEKAVQDFQKKHGLPGSGVIGYKTLELLKIKIETPVETPQDDWFDLALEITGKFEGKGFGQITGNFDKMGVSAGILQWNYGQGSLQSKILKPYLARFGSIDKLGIFPGPMDHSAAMSTSQGVQFAVNTMHVKGTTRLLATWAQAWERFLLTPEVISLQKEAASGVRDSALKLCGDWGIMTPRAFCFFFDIVTQNGSMKTVKKPRANLATVKQYIAEADSKNKKIWQTASVNLTEEQMVLFQTAYLRAKLSNPTYFNDVLSRKGTIAIGAGYVHGKNWKFNF